MLLIATDEKESLVPGPTLPVFVTERVGLAEICISSGKRRKQSVIRTRNTQVTRAIEEGCSNSKDFLWFKSNVESSWDRGSGWRQDVEKRLVASLNGQD